MFYEGQVGLVAGGPGSGVPNLGLAFSFFSHHRQTTSADSNAPVLPYLLYTLRSAEPRLAHGSVDSSHQCAYVHQGLGWEP